MITIYAGTSIIVSNGNGQFSYPVGTWQVSDVHLLRPGTNAWVPLSLNDGSTVSVDLGGYVEAINQPSASLSALSGFTLAAMLVGTLLVMKWAVKAAGKVTVE